MNKKKNLYAYRFIFAVFGLITCRSFFSIVPMPPVCVEILFFITTSELYLSTDMFWLSNLYVLKFFDCLFKSFLFAVTLFEVKVLAGTFFSETSNQNLQSIKKKKIRSETIFNSITSSIETNLPSFGCPKFTGVSFKESWV